MSQVPDLTPEQEQRAVDAVSALGTTTEERAAQHVISEVLRVTTDIADAILECFIERGVFIQRAEANNVLETGHVSTPRTRWDRGTTPTLLEVANVLTGLTGYINLEVSAQALCKAFNCSFKDASDLLYEVRDRYNFRLSTDGPGPTRWYRISDI